MAQMTGLLTYQGIPVWRHARILRWVTQIVSGFLAVVLVAWFFLNIGGAIQDRNIPYGFSFLDREYQTPIGHHFLPYESSDTFFYALGVAATNTVVVSIIGVILATALGIVIGVARLSGNWIVSKLALAYVEFFRNVPLLVQLFFWFYIFLALPPERDGFVFFDRLYVNNAGISTPWPVPSDLSMGLVWLGLVLIGVIAGVFVHRMLLKRETMTGKASYPLVSGVTTVVGVGAVTWIVLMVAGGESPFVISEPVPREGPFGRVAGGFTAPAGLLALLIGLVMYTASFIAEIVRAGITSVGKGQTEAARALGLSNMAALRHDTFPQALRVIIPPLISQFLNLTKNSSLAGAIGYSDLTNVAKTMTQTAPAVSIFILIMLSYLAMSLAYSLAGNLYNRYVRITGA
ncbi:MAG: ABC transporter permease subunit [Chloroflexota bacterium]|nr:ABC transporter permease subunit [Chloroflexota bacterium]